MALTLEQFSELQKGTTHFCLIGKVTQTADKGGDSIRFAIHGSDVIFGGEQYKPVPATVSKFQATSGTEVDNATFQTVLDDALSRLNIKGGKWQGASVELFIVNYLNPEMGYIQRQGGRFGQAKIIGNEAEIEYRGLTSLLSQEIGEKTSRLCRYQLGDADCKVNVASFTFEGIVTSVANRQKFTVSVAKPDGYFYRGRITFASGGNQGLSMETQNNAGQVITLFQPMIRDVEVDDEIVLVAGDDKTLATCHNKFNNAINFGGEPEIPPREKLYKFP